MTGAMTYLGHEGVSNLPATPTEQQGHLGRGPRGDWPGLVCVLETVLSPRGASPSTVLLVLS